MTVATAERASTALTVTPSGEPWEPKTLEKLKDFPQSRYNLLVPTVSLRQVNPYLVPDIDVVQLAETDIYHDSQMPADQHAPNARGLSKLADVAGITMLDSRRMDDGKDPDVVEWRVDVEMTAPSGRTRHAIGSKRIDLHQLATGWTAARLAKAREHLVANAETKAFNRAIRAVLSLHGSYPKAQLLKPFAVLRYVPDMSHPEVRKAFLNQLVPASAQAFGPVQDAAPQLTSSGDIDIAPEAPDEDPAPVATPATETQAATDEPDWFTSDQPAFAKTLLERAAGGSTDPADPMQRANLKAALKNNGKEQVEVVLKGVFGLEAISEITSAQAEAILDEAREPLFPGKWAELFRHYSDKATAAS